MSIALTPHQLNVGRLSLVEGVDPKGGIAKVDRRLNAHPLYLFPNNRLLVNRFSVIDKHLCHLRITTSTSKFCFLAELLHIYSEATETFDRKPG